MASRLTTAARALLDVFYPRFCIVCDQVMSHERGYDLCPSCESALMLPEGRYCPKCCAPMARYAVSCPNCHNMTLAMTGATAFGFYDGVLRRRIMDFKFSGRRYLARTLGALAGSAARRHWPDVRFDAVTAVPLHPARRRERGFDQGRELARQVAGVLGAPYRPRLLKRVRATGSQVGLVRTARVQNVKDAFEAAPVRLEAVLLVDDILTTGATMSQAARALRKAGVKAVYAAVVARTGLGAVPLDEPSSEGERLLA